MNENIFDKWNEWVNDTEGSIVNFLTAFAPWLAPLAPSFMTFQHMNDFLHFPTWVAFAVAILVEILGFGTVSTFLDFWFYNRREKSGAKKAPLEIVIFSFGFYLLLILVSNVAIDITQSYLSVEWQKGAIILVRLLLTLQTIPGAMIVAARTGHKDLLREMKLEKQEKDMAKLGIESSKKVPDNSNKEQEGSKKDDWRKIRSTLSSQDLANLANFTPNQIREHSIKTGYTYKTISNWRTRARQELNITDDIEVNGEQELDIFMARFIDQKNKLPSIQEIMNFSSIAESEANLFLAEFVVKNKSVLVQKSIVSQENITNALNYVNDNKNEVVKTEDPDPWG